MRFVEKKGSPNLSSHIPIRNNMMSFDIYRRRDVSKNNSHGFQLYFPILLLPELTDWKLINAFSLIDPKIKIWKPLSSHSSFPPLLAVIATATLQQYPISIWSVFSVL